MFISFHANSIHANYKSVKIWMQYHVCLETLQQAMKVGVEDY